MRVGIAFGCYCPLHQGHLDVIMRAKKENDITVEEARSQMEQYLVGAVVGFYYIDNRWLEDRHTNHLRW